MKIEQAKEKLLIKKYEEILLLNIKKHRRLDFKIKDDEINLYRNLSNLFVRLLRILLNNYDNIEMFIKLSKPYLVDGLPHVDNKINHLSIKNKQYYTSVTLSLYDMYTLILLLEREREKEKNSIIGCKKEKLFAKEVTE
ncbi:TPA: hypothetical protein U4681_001780 [Streptococcus agalactiae]|nr:hypothetical protein [Streptococcus agalactiae]HEN3176187.1 hypothetical protein [Streptococcus agalactiae]HEN3189009.1 hypothetical protein [Streptococcus agalactiae]